MVFFFSKWFSAYICASINVLVFLFLILSFPAHLSLLTLFTQLINRIIFTPVGVLTNRSASLGPLLIASNGGNSSASSVPAFVCLLGT